MLGNNCFFLDTTTSKNALLSFNSFPNAAFIVSCAFSPNTIISELLFNISVIANTNNDKPSDGGSNNKPTDGGSNNKPSDKENGSISCVSTLITLLSMILILI